MNKPSAIYLVFAILLVHYTACNPTEYKMNKQKIYEAELIPVSSTVIPLPIYEAASNNLKFPGALGIKREEKNVDKEMKPVGPLTLITSANKKAHYQKFKSDDVSTVKKTS